MLLLCEKMSVLVALSSTLDSQDEVDIGNQQKFLKLGKFFALTISVIFNNLTHHLASKSP